MDYITVQIDNLIKLAMEYSDFTKLEGIKDVRVDCTMWALQMYITCDNGDVIQLIYEFGSCKIYAALVGMHCSNDALIPVCKDGHAREELIRKLMDEASHPILSSDRKKQCTIHPFLYVGHAVYYIKPQLTDIHAAKCLFRRIAEDVICLHKDGTLLDIAHMWDARVYKEVTEEWALC